MKKLLVVLLVLVAASSAFGAVSQELAASDPRISPYIDFTKQNGARLLPGRYMHAKELPQASGGQKAVSPTTLNMEIASLDPEQLTYSVNADLWGQDLMPMYMALDFSQTVPLLRTYALENEGQYELIAEDFAVVMSDGKKHLWLIGSTETGEIRFMYPLTENWFPANWYTGSWKAPSGTTYSFADGTASINGQNVGKFIVSDNRIVITRADGSKQVFYAMLNTDTDNLVMTSAKGEELTAEILSRSSEQTKPAAPAFPTTKPAPKFTPPQPTAPAPESPQRPSGFPEMPDVQMPDPPAPSLEGVWGAYVNGQQWVIQYQGNNYYGWINGQPSEMGIVQFDGKVVTGRNNAGTTFMAEVQFGNNGQTMTMTFANGNTITYQKLQ